MHGGIVALCCTTRSSLVDSSVVGLCIVWPLPGVAAAAFRVSSWVYDSAQAEHGVTEGCSHDSLSSRLVLCVCQLTGWHAVMGSSLALLAGV
jgi:hypothetical protein